jgi:hypothetical protein
MPENRMTESAMQHEAMQVAEQQAVPDQIQQASAKASQEVVAGESRTVAEPRVGEIAMKEIAATKEISDAVSKLVVGEKPDALVGPKAGAIWQEDRHNDALGMVQRWEEVSEQAEVQLKDAFRNILNQAEATRDALIQAATGAEAVVVQSELGSAETNDRLRSLQLTVDDAAHEIAELRNAAERGDAAVAVTLQSLNERAEEIRHLNPQQAALDDSQQLITDAAQSAVLFDNQAVAATQTQAANQVAAAKESLAADATPILVGPQADIAWESDREEEALELARKWEEVSAQAEVQLKDAYQTVVAQAQGTRDALIEAAETFKRLADRPELAGVDIDQRLKVIDQRLEAVQQVLGDAQRDTRELLDAAERGDVAVADTLQSLNERAEEIRQLNPRTQGFSITENLTNDAIAEATRAYIQRFSSTPQLDRLWTEAAEGLTPSPTGFARARANFWDAINNGDSEDAKYARNVLDVAGFELGDSTNAPMLKMPDGTSNSERRLTIDHIDPKKDFPALTLESSNLSFLISRDNSFKGINRIKDQEIIY